MSGAFVPFLNLSYPGSTTEFLSPLLMFFLDERHFLSSGGNGGAGYEAPPLLAD